MNKRFAAWLPSVALIHVCSLLVVLPTAKERDVVTLERFYSFDLINGNAGFI